MAIKSTSEKLFLNVTRFLLRILLNVLFYGFVVFLIINVSKLMFDFTYQLYGPVSVKEAPGTEITVVIEKGDSTMDVATKLETNRAIVNKYAFYVKAKLQESVIMPGTYNINNSMTYDNILDQITDLSNSTTKEEDSKEKDSKEKSGGDQKSDSKQKSGT